MTHRTLPVAAISLAVLLCFAEAPVRLAAALVVLVGASVSAGLHQRARLFYNPVKRIRLPERSAPMVRWPTLLPTVVRLWNGFTLVCAGVFLIIALLGCLLGQMTPQIAAAGIMAACVFGISVGERTRLQAVTPAQPEAMGRVQRQYRANLVLALLSLAALQLPLIASLGYALFLGFWLDHFTQPLGDTIRAEFFHRIARPERR